MCSSQARSLETACAPPQRSEAFAPNTFILTACENELKRGDSTEATAKLEARIAATLANVTKEVQLLFTLTRRLPSQILYCSTFCPPWLNRLKTCCLRLADARRQDTQRFFA